MAALHSLRNRASLSCSLVFSSLCSLCLCGSTFAALDGEAKKPYKLTIVLHVADNRLLTDVFRDRIERELGDGLHAALGDLAEVKVVREHPKLAEVLDKGLRSLDNWTERSDVKTHFVLIDFSGVNYEIQARQYDGLTGLAWPPASVVRREKTQDREFVARTAALLIERDFGPIATFQAWPKERKKPQKVQLELKGGGLDGPLNRWVQKGDVFAVVQIPAGNGRGRLVPDAIVQIETPPQPEGHDSLCTGNLFWRREMISAGAAGYRCIKLGATHGPLKVQLVQVEKGVPGELRFTPTLLVRRDGFNGLGELQVHANGKVHGLYDTSKLGEQGQFDRVAFVSIFFGGRVRAEIPLVLLDDQPIVVQAALEDDDKADAEKEKQWWRRNVYDSYAVQTSVFTELQEKSAKKTPRADLIALAKEGLQRSEEDVQRLRQERARIFAGKLTEADLRDRAQGDQRIKALEDGVQQLKDYIDKQAAIDKEENSEESKNRQAQIVRADLFEKDGELGRAITIYTELLKTPDFPGRADMDAHLKKLRDLWQPKSAAHREARDFIYDVWPTLDTEGLQLRLKDAYAALKECRNAGDVLGPQRFSKGIQIHVARLLKEAEGLRDINEEDAKQLKNIKDLAKSLTQLETEIKAYLERMQKGG